jgi:hypothetical protein
MPIIRCLLGKDGKITTSSVEFLPGDAIQFLSDRPIQGPADPLHLPSFTLNDVSAHLSKEALVLHIPEGGSPPPPHHTRGTFDGRVQGGGGNVVGPCPPTPVMLMPEP